MERSNEEWRAELAAGNPAAVAGLREFLRRGLTRALAGRADAHLVEDFAQEAVIKVLGSLPSFRGDSRLTTWALAIAIRIAFSELRKARYRDVPLDERQNEQAAPMEEPTEPKGGSALATLRKLIETSLTEKQRMVILGELQGIPQAVLAERMGTNRNALYKLGHDARMKLKAGLLAAGLTAEDVRAEP